MLDRFGEMLGLVYYKVLARGFRLAAIMASTGPVIRNGGARRRDTT